MFFKRFSSGLFILLALPASTSYKIIGGYSIGGGGTSSNSSTYTAQEQIGGTDSNPTSTTYSTRPGFNGAQQANTPLAPTLDNAGNHYNKLHFVVTPDSDPSDTIYAVAISSDGFATTQYVKSDNTVGSTLVLTDYQTYTSWGSAAGTYIIGLKSSTTYSVKVKAFHGKFTETGFGPISSVATSTPSLTFVLSTENQSVAPFSVTFGSLTANTVISATQKVITTISTNGVLGGNIYLVSQNAGLKSIAVNKTIISATGDLSSLSEGYGVQGFSSTQVSGGPIGFVTPYNTTGTLVGIIDITPRLIIQSSLPITTGQATVVLKAKSASTTSSASDYSDTLTFTASANF